MHKLSNSNYLITNLISQTMARPIKETPVLKGKDAKTFLANKANSAKASEETKRRIMQNYQKFSAMAVKQ